MKFSRGASGIPSSGKTRFQDAPSTDISIRDLVSLVEGSVIALDRDANQSMDVLVNGTLIAHGEIVVVDNRFGVRLTDVVSPTERIENLN